MTDDQLHNLDEANRHLYEYEADYPGNHAWPTYDSESADDMRRDLAYRVNGALRRGIPSCRFVGIERVAAALATLDGEIWPSCDRHIPYTYPEAQRAAMIAQRRQRYRHEARHAISEYVSYMEIAQEGDTEESRNQIVEQAKSQHMADAQVSAKWRGSVGLPSTVKQIEDSIPESVRGTMGEIILRGELLRKSKLGIILAVSLLLATPAFAQSGPIAAAIAGNVADLVSTEIALSRGGAREANPVMQGTAQRIALKAGTTALTVWAIKKLAPQHPKTAAVLGYTVGAVMGGLAVNNVRVMR